MFICDSHFHSNFSYDGEDDVYDICKSARQKGIDQLNVTDHFESAYCVTPFLHSVDTDRERAAMEKCAEDFKGQIKLIRGIELGEPHYYPEYTAEFLEKFEPQYVIGSVHRLRNTPDFYYLDYSRMDSFQIDLIMNEYFDEIYDMLDCDYVDTLSHLGYPYRYMKERGVEVNFEDYYDKIDAIFKKLIEKGKSLEINTSGLFKPMKDFLPLPSVAKRYFELGGKLVTIGSDAHNRDRIGAGFDKAVEMLKEFGIYEYTVYDGISARQEKFD